MSFAVLIIFLTPFGTQANIEKDSVEYNMSKTYWLFDGIHSIVSSPENEKTSKIVIEELLIKSPQNTQNNNSQQAEPAKPKQPNDI